MLKSIYNQKITIINKLKRADSGEPLDRWFKTEIDDAAWYSRVQRTVAGGNVQIGTYVICLIPQHPEYMNTLDWKELADKTTHFTMSSGDYIVLGEVPEEIRADNVVNVMQSYGANVCLVKHIEELHNRYNRYVQLRIEGT